MTTGQLLWAAAGALGTALYLAGSRVCLVWSGRVIPVCGLRRGVRASGPSQGRTGESGAFSMWPHPRGSSRYSFLHSRGDIFGSLCIFAKPFFCRFLQEASREKSILDCFRGKPNSMSPLKRMPTKGGWINI